MDTKVLYHYTTQDGLLGIIGSEGEEPAIWATNIFYLNDSREFNLAIDLARKEVEKMPEYEHYLKAQRNSIDRNGAIVPQSEVNVAIAAILSVIDSFSLRTTNEYVYVCSFSADDGNSLSQWRAYSRGGASYSIGFKFDILSHIATQNRFTINKCIYESYIQESAVKDAITSVFTAMTESAHHPRDHLTVYCRVLIQSLFKIAPTIKEKSFRDEEEWRLISPLEYDDKPKFRKGLSMILPYVRFPVLTEKGEPAINSIRIGPSPYPELSWNSVKALLATKEWAKQVKVLKFEGSFRGNV